MYKYLLAGVVAFAAVPASAATFVVGALPHSASYGTGTGLATGLVFNAGDALTVASSTDDLWSAGALPRFSDANGLVGDRFATATDDSDEAVGTLIGSDKGTLTIGGFGAPYGSLVGQYGDGTYQFLGANFNGVAAGTGALTLFYWDSNLAGNAGEVTFDINGAIGGAVPEPATWALLILGFGMVGGTMRRRRVSVSYA